MARKMDYKKPEDYHTNGPCGAKVSHIINSEEFCVDHCPECDIFIYKNRKSEEMEVSKKSKESILAMTKQIEIEQGENTELSAIFKYLRNLPANKSDKKWRKHERYGGQELYQHV